ncbi:MAG: PEP-CTERM sorting domain-containing protein [Planctomycetales bacterium]|nr:PEP-CTERM sorting domain-containing protein [Planctomycetales bacterium]
MKFTSYVLGAMLSVVLATTAQAGITGSAFVDVKGLKIVKVSGGATVTADFISFPGISVSEIRGISTTTSGVNETSLSGFVDGGESASITIVGTPVGGFILPIGTDPPVAYSGSGVAPADNAFLVPTTPQSVRADSTFSGSFADLSGDLNPAVAAIPAGAAATTLADFAVTVPSLVGKGGAAVRNTTSYDFVAATDLTTKIVWEELIDLNLLDTGGVSPVYSSFASTGFTITLTEITPTGTAIVTYENFESITQTGPGSETFSSGGFVAKESVVFDLKAGGKYTLDVSQTSFVQFSPVPEPSSLLAFMGVGAIGLVRRRRRQA